MDEKRSSLGERIKQNIIFGILWLIATGIAASVRFKVEGLEKLDQMDAAGKGGLVLLWHGVTILPIYYCRHRGYYSLVSVSRDGMLQNRLLRSRGYKIIEGSSGRHGMRALLEAVRKLQSGAVLAITPDGPKGPPKVVQPGTILMAQRSHVPVLPVGLACKPCKRLHSWDSHLVPMPFSRAALVFGDELFIGPEESEESAAIKIAEAINAAERRAEEIIG